MTLTLTARETAEIIRKRKSKGRQRLNGRKLAETNTGKADRGRMRDPGFLAYLRRQPCEARHLGGCEGPIHAAHIRYSDAAKGSVNPGMQRKNHDHHAHRSASITTCTISTSGLSGLSGPRSERTLTTRLPGTTPAIRASRDD
jgi:hypothetical protein